jgi:hypothetical protein
MIRLPRDETDVVVGLDGEVRADDARFTRARRGWTRST